MTDFVPFKAARTVGFKSAVSDITKNVITPASFVVDRARFCDMNEKVKIEEPFKMHKHKAIAMMKWSCHITRTFSVIPPNVD
jgi:anaerobic ribonucleoside-triphosphate reductase